MMADRLRSLLDEPTPQNLRRLFLEELRWGSLRSEAQALEYHDVRLTAEPLAELCGITVWRIQWHEPTLPTITQRRTIYGKLSAVALEHVLCYVTSDASQLAITWARRRDDGSIELRTVPYERGSPARTTLEQLCRLAFTLDDLGSVSYGRVLDKLNEAFSVERVNKQFFEDYREVFHTLERRLRDASGDPRWAHDYALQLLNRLMFLYFIQRKGWLGGDRRFVATFWRCYKQSGQPKDSFFDRWLSVLFFEAFNEKFHGGHRHFPEKIRDALAQAPYLNGGLFSRNQLDQRAAEITIPDEFFELLFDRFRGSEPGFLERYNFTITESTPLDVEVAVDPEMIGKVYESLVNITFEGITEEDLRSKAGIFYTPRTEIALMCRLSLVDYLANHLGEDLKPLLYDAVFARSDEEKERADRALTERNLWQKLDELLRSVTVCDPACGSGSFLVGMLLVLDDLQARANRELGKEETPYERRRRIIGEQLYGVDVMEWAVHVAELRLWLQLVVETELEPAELKFRPLLPNLSFKIRCGDSLVQEIGGINFGLHRAHLDIPAPLKGRITQLKGKKLHYYYGERGITKDALEAEERQLFRDVLQHRLIQLQQQIQSTTLQLTQPEATQLGLATLDPGTDQQKVSALLHQRLETLNAELEQLKQALNAFASAKQVPFIWDVAFVEIFEGDKGGFDIVIGNPPYVRQEQIAPPTLDPNDFGGEQSERWKEQKKRYKEKLQASVAAAWPTFFGYKPGSDKFRKPDGKSDLYVYFYFHGLSLLNEKGSFCFITSNSWLDVGYGAELQEFLLRHSHVKFIIDNEKKRSFPGADVNTIIALLAPPDDRRDVVAAQRAVPLHARFVMFKAPFEEVIDAETFKVLEAVTDRQVTDRWRITVRSQRELLEEGLVQDEGDDTPTKLKTVHLKTRRYQANKWGGKYLRAPDIFFTILRRNGHRLKKLGVLCQVEGYIHDNNTGKAYPKALFIKSVKDTQAIMIKRTSPGVIYYGVKATGNSRTVAPILFPRTLSERHLIVYNPDGIFGKEFYKVIPKDSNFTIAAAAQLNSTFAILQRELFGVVNLGEGGLKFSSDDVSLFLLSPDLSSADIEPHFIKLASRVCLPIFDEIHQPDRRALDDVVFDVLGLTAGEREAVYEAVINLVRARLEKARSV